MCGVRFASVYAVHGSILVQLSWSHLCIVAFVYLQHTKCTGWPIRELLNELFNTCQYMVCCIAVMMLCAWRLLSRHNHTLTTVPVQVTFRGKNFGPVATPLSIVINSQDCTEPTWTSDSVVSCTPQRMW